MKKNLFTLLLLFCCLYLTAQNRYLEPVFDQVQVTHDVVYGVNATVETIPITGQATPLNLLMDFYEPVGDTVANRPVVIVVHRGDYIYYLAGSCIPWYQDSLTTETCTRLAKMGYTVAAINLRTGWSPLNPSLIIRFGSWVNAYYRSIQDVRTAVRFLKKSTVEDANPFRIDTSRIVLWGENTGGVTVLGAAYANSFVDWVYPTLMVGPSTPAVLESVNGNIEGSSYGVVPPNHWLYPAGDTLCYPNWAGYSSKFQLVVSIAGAIPNLPWVGPGEPPAIMFHAFSDNYVPCYIGPWVPPSAPFTFELSGSCALAPILLSSGCNQVFDDISLSDPITLQANLYNNGNEGFYPFTGATPVNGEPWYWGAPCAAISSVNTDATTARLYLDTVFAYFAPRACIALNLNCSTGSSTTAEPVQTGSIGIAPNPASGSIHIALPEEANYDLFFLQIFNTQGMSMFATPIRDRAENIDITNWSSGHYTVTLTSRKGVISSKFIKG